MDRQQTQTRQEDRRTERQPDRNRQTDNRIDRKELFVFIFASTRLRLESVNLLHSCFIFTLRCTPKNRTPFRLPPSHPIPSSCESESKSKSKSGSGCRHLTHRPLQSTLACDYNEANLIIRSPPTLKTHALPVSVSCAQKGNLGAFQPSLTGLIALSATAYPLSATTWSKCRTNGAQE